MSDTDAVQKIVEQWSCQRPDLDVRPMEVLGRLTRTSQLVDKELNKVFARYKLHAREFDILATLRRSGEPFALSPSQIVESLMVNNSTMTNRLDRLEEAGRIKRVPIKGDRRGVHVELTKEGLKLIDHVVEEHLENEKAILGPLSEKEQASLAKLLSKLEKKMHKPSSE